MSKIGGGGIPPKTPGTTPAENQPADLKTKDGVQKFRETAGKDIPTKVVDSFSRAGPALESKLQSLSNKVSPKLNFTNADLALLAQTFAHILKKNPNADRLKRAKLFAQAIIKKRRFGKIFENADEEELEEMFDLIASQLDESPVFAQLVDDVTESARKINL